MAKAQAEKAGEKVNLDKAQQCWLSFKAQHSFGHGKLNNCSVVRWKDGKGDPAVDTAGPVKSLSSA